jgi:hypothetical protein
MRQFDFKQKQKEVSQILSNFFYQITNTNAEVNFFIDGISNNDLKLEGYMLEIVYEDYCDPEFQSVTSTMDNIEKNLYHFVDSIGVDQDFKVKPRSKLKTYLIGGPLIYKIDYSIEEEKIKILAGFNITLG